MIKLKSNNGITLAVLIVTILVMAIILGITIDISTDTVDSTIDSQDASEMLMIQHAIQERYVEYLETKDNNILVGKHSGVVTEKKYRISSEEKLSEVLPAETYYIAIRTIPTTGKEERVLYYMKNGVAKEITTYKNTITNVDLTTCTEDESTNVFGTGFDEYKEITKPNDVKVDCLAALGITGQGMSNSVFEVDYETGEVKKIGSSTPQLKGYKKDKYDNTTSTEIDIYN